MKLLSFIKKYNFLYGIFSALFVIVAFSSISSAQITKNPISEPIEKSKLSIGLEEVVKIPDSGSEDEISARLNRLIPAGDGRRRLFSR